MLELLDRAGVAHGHQREHHEQAPTVAEQSQQMMQPPPLADQHHEDREDPGIAACLPGVVLRIGALADGCRVLRHRRGGHTRRHAEGLFDGRLTPWLCQELLVAGIPAICIETRHAKAAMKARNVKTDRNDARGIAHMMRTGWYRAVHVKTTDSQKLRVLIGNRRFLLDKRLDIDSRIRGTFKAFGLKVGKTSVGTFEARIREPMEEDNPHRTRSMGWFREPRPGRLKSGRYRLSAGARGERIGAGSPVPIDQRTLFIRSGHGLPPVPNPRNTAVGPSGHRLRQS